MSNELSQSVPEDKQTDRFSDLQSPELASYWLRALIESADDAIISKTLDGIITSWNPGAERIFGYRAKEIIGKPITILFPPDHLNEEPEILARIRAGERVDHYETVRVRKDGRLVDISLTISPIKNADGRIVGASKIARDIGERKRVEESLWSMPKLSKQSISLAKRWQVNSICTNQCRL
jgi:PAS domain S-box-containing protein